MSKLIDFLERLGQDSQSHQATGDELQLAMARAGIEPAMRSALISADRQQLQARAGAAPNVCCLVHTADDGDEDGDTFTPASVRSAA